MWMNIIRLFRNEPELLFEHAANYAALARLEFNELRARIVARAALGLLALVLLIALINTLAIAAVLASAALITITAAIWIAP
jgi:predicted HTH domain antitoxin